MTVNDSVNWILGDPPSSRTCYDAGMSRTNFTDLHQALFTAAAQLQHAIDVANEVHPQGHRVLMARSQLEAALLCIDRAKQFTNAKTSGAWTRSEIPLPLRPTLRAPKDDRRDDEGPTSPPVETPFSKK